jgi:hypothetical protein
MPSAFARAADPARWGSRYSDARANTPTCAPTAAAIPMGTALATSIPSRMRQRARARPWSASYQSFPPDRPATQARTSSRL